MKTLRGGTSAGQFGTVAAGQGGLVTVTGVKLSPGTPTVLTLTGP